MFLRPSDSATILFPLSELLRRLLADDHNSTILSGSSDPALSQRLLRAMQRSEILWKSPFPHNKMVFKCHPNMVVKAVRKMEEYTEYTTLQYLERHRPSVPAPRPLGAMRMSGVSLMFMTYVAETTLEEVWTRLDAVQKASIQNQLDKILTDLRSLLHPDGTPFGGVEEEGCKDLRRHLRRSTKPIMNISDFEDFLFSVRILVVMSLLNCSVNFPRCASLLCLSRLKVCLLMVICGLTTSWWKSPTVASASLQVFWIGNTAAFIPSIMSRSRAQTAWLLLKITIGICSCHSVFHQNNILHGGFWIAFGGGYWNDRP